MTKDRSSYLTIPSASPAKQATGFPDDGMIDNLTYAYNGNQLQSVHDVNDPNHQNNGFTDDGSFLNTEYTYDDNGNLLSDLNKNLSISKYNHLNLPEQLNLNPPQHYYEISYLYSAAGQKLHKATHIDFTPATTTDYVGSFIYQDGLLQSILTPEGRVVVNGSSYEYQYFLKDHLGNTRVTFNSGGIIQEDSYYPYGMNMSGLSESSGTDLPNKFLYNGKELQDDFGLDWYDYGARFYDAQLGRWHVVDNKAEKYYGITQYAYAIGNPLRFLDPDGNEIVDATGKPITYDAKNGWSSNANEDVIRIGNAMMQSRTGKAQFNNMMSVSHPIQLIISPLDKGGTLGISRIKRKVVLNDNGEVIDVQIVSAIIEIYEGSIKNLLENSTISGSDTESQNLIDAYRESTKTIDQAIGAVSGHESSHTTDPQNQHELAENDFEGANNDVEKKPREIEKQILKEFSDRNLNKLEPIDPFRR